MPSDTQDGFAFLEALTSDISVESLGRDFDGVSAHTGMKVRPSTSGNIPSTLQLLPGQSFYIGKTTLSLVPEEHSDLPIYSSGLPDSNLENYNHQVSQISTPERTARPGSTVMETPLLHSDNDANDLMPILEQINGQAISERNDGMSWPESCLKREIMRTARDTPEHSHSSSQPDIKTEYEHVADAVIHVTGRSKPEVRNGDEDIASATAAQLPKGNVEDLEDAELASAELRSEDPGKSKPLLSHKSRVHSDGELGGSSPSPLEESMPSSSSVLRVRPSGKHRASSRSPTPTGPKPSSLSAEQTQPERVPEPSDQSPVLQALSRSESKIDDDLENTPVRKKAKTDAVCLEVLSEESLHSLQGEKISVNRGISVSTNCPFPAVQASSMPPKTQVQTGPRSRSAKQPKQRPPGPLTGSEYLSPAVDPHSATRSANQPASGVSFNSAGANPRIPLSEWNSISASPCNSLEPSSSKRSTRSTARDEYDSPSSTDTGKRILFASSSSVGDSKPFLRFLSTKGVKCVQSVHDCTILCVGKELKKTSKLILAVLLGKDIVTDSWVTDSVKGSDLLSVVPYMARDPKKEAEWDITLDEAIYRGKQGLKVLQDQTVIFTPSAKKELGKTGFDELKEIVKCAGASAVSSALPKKSPKDTSSTLVVATHNSSEMAELQRLGWRAFVKDIISLSVLRGKLDLESDEFLIQIQEQKKESRKRKR